MKNVKSLFEIFKSSISFLTILPVKSDVSTMENFKKIVLFFPLTAFFLGTYYYMCSYIIYLISGSIFFTAIIYTSLTVILTGGLHYDGLSDSIDGLFCGKDKDKMLEVMSDSRIGTFGVLAIVLNIMLKTGIIYLFIQGDILPFAIFSVIFSRTMQVMFAYSCKYAKEDGMGNIFIGKIDKKQFSFVICSFFILSFAVAVVFSMSNLILRELVLRYFIISTILSVLVLLRMKKSIEQKIGGITGDILGLVAEVSETTFLYMTYISIKLVNYIIYKFVY